MRILADEDVEYPIIERLRADGHIVTAIIEVASGTADPPILARAVAEHILLLTADKDFGDLVYLHKQQAPDEGVVLYRLGEEIETPRKAEIVSDAFQANAADFAHHFSVIDEHKVRFRPLPPTTMQP